MWIRYFSTWQILNGCPLTICLSERIILASSSTEICISAEDWGRPSFSPTCCTDKGHCYKSFMISMRAGDERACATKQRCSLFSTFSSRIVCDDIFSSSLQIHSNIVRTTVFCWTQKKSEQKYCFCKTAALFFSVLIYVLRLFCNSSGDIITL